MTEANRWRRAVYRVLGAREAADVTRPPFGYVAPYARGRGAFLRSSPWHYRVRRQFKFARWSGHGRASAAVAVVRTNLPWLP